MRTVLNVLIAGRGGGVQQSHLRTVSIMRNIPSERHGLLGMRVWVGLGWSVNGVGSFRVSGFRVLGFRLLLSGAGLSRGLRVELVGVKGMDKIVSRM